MFRKSIVRLTGLLATAMLVGCTDDPVTPLNNESFLDPNNTSTAQRVVGAIELRPLQVLDVQVQATGSLRPGEPIQVLVTVAANVSTPSARLQLVLPEYEVERLTGGQLRKPDTGTVRPVVERSLSLQRGQSAVEHVSLRIGNEGYYRLVASAHALSIGDDIPTETLVQNIAFEEIWLYVDSMGGTVTSEFDTTLFADTVIANPGRRRYKPRRISGGAAPSSSPSSSWTYLGRAVYWNGNTGTLDPIKNTKVDGWFYGDDDPIYNYWHTDAAGNFAITPPPGGFEFIGQVRLRNDDVAISPGSQSNIYVPFLYSDPTRHDHVIPNAARARGFVNVNASAAQSQSILGYSRPSAVTVDVQAAGAGGSYNSGSDHIVIRGQTVFGQAGFFVGAHEYGHAVHEKALNGNVAGGTCPNPHFINSAHNLQCGYSEGFANFHAAITVPESLTTELGSDYRLEINDYYSPAEDGGQVEGVIAAFLYDMVDGPNTPDSFTNQPNGDDDEMEYPGSYVASIIRTCQVRPSGGSLTRADGIDHLIYCFERLVDPAVTGSIVYFTTRNPDPIAFSEGAVEPSAWNRDDIRCLWTEVLYGSCELYSPPPLNASISDEPSEVQPMQFCSWSAGVSGGLPPYTYNWSGVLSGSGSSVMGLVPESGWLNLTVTDDASSQFNTAKFITVDWMAPECF